MSSKGTLFLTNDYNEHCYTDCSEYYKNDQGGVSDSITIEFSKENIRVDANDNEDLVITITNVNSEIYKIFEQISKLATKEQK